MLKPSIETHNVDGILVAEFWECLRLDPRPCRTRVHYEAHLKAQGRPDVVVDLSGVGFAGLGRAGKFRGLAAPGAFQGGPNRVLRGGSDGRRGFSREQARIALRVRRRSVGRYPCHQRAAAGCRRKPVRPTTASDEPAPADGENPGEIRIMNGAKRVRLAAGAEIMWRRTPSLIAAAPHYAEREHVRPSQPTRIRALIF